MPIASLPAQALNSLLGVVPDQSSNSYMQLGFRVVLSKAFLAEHRVLSVGIPSLSCFCAVWGWSWAPPGLNPGAKF